MRMSKMFSKTLREAPNGADSRGYELLLRAGFIKQLGTGIFTLLPFALRSTQKIENIIREEMNRIGGEEILLSVINPADIWKETGRFYSIDKEMGRFKDRTGRDMVLAMTNEETVTDCARGEIDSYKRLPVMVYQIQTKWRDDPRPRAGLIRVREFKMKDAYSFHTSQESLDKAYADQYKAYFRIFSRTGLPCIAVGADSGMMGGKISHEYMYLSPLGEDTIISCPECGYTENRQVAKFKKTEYKEKELPKKKIATPDSSTIEELCAYLKIEKRKTAKAVFYVGSFINSENGEEKDRLVVAIIRGDMEVEESKLSNLIKANSLRPARGEEIEECGMVPGFASPIGAKGDFISIADDSIVNSNNLVAGANESGYHYINTNYDRDWKADFTGDISSAYDGALCPVCGKPLKSNKGIEIGNIFQLGTRYSEALNCTYQDENGVQKPVIMGCYGIGIGRLLGCLAEEYNDEKGLCLPISVSPYEVEIVSLVKDNDAVDNLYNTLKNEGIETLYDDRKDTAGVKFTDADLIGIPIRITIGNKSLKENKAEVKLRRNGEEKEIPLDNLLNEIKMLIKEEKDRIKIVEKEWIK